MTRRHLLLGFAAVPAYYALRLALRNEFVVTNESGREIHELRVKVCGQAFQLGSLPPGSSASGRFRAPMSESESVFDVQGQFENGEPFADYCGYVVWEDSARTFELFIRPDGMVTTLHE